MELPPLLREEPVLGSLFGGSIVCSALSVVTPWGVAEGFSGLSLLLLLSFFVGMTGRASLSAARQAAPKLRAGAQALQERWTRRPEADAGAVSLAPTEDGALSVAGEPGALTEAPRTGARTGSGADG